MKIKIFNTEIDIREHYCALNNFLPSKIEQPYINLYVQFKGCNANCKFCEFKNCANTFNLPKFENVILELSKQIELRKISLTGGEATINKNFYKVVDIVKPYTNFLVVNTNGSNLIEMYNNGYDKKFESIALSRHHYNDEINNEILGLESISSNDLEQMKLKNLHFSCNLQKDYINSKEEIYKYLDFVSSIGYDDVGFVSLMDINNYTKEQLVDFEKLELISDRYYKIKEWRYKDFCKCNNYLYLTENGDVVKVYSRYNMKPSNSISNLVFDGENLKTGFCGEIIF